MNILCTSKPCDGLFYYSYEYSKLFNVPLVVITHPEFSKQDYIESIQHKYTICKDIFFDDYIPGNEETFILGRSMLTLPYLNRKKYTEEQLFTLHLLFQNDLIVVYSENHPIDYEYALLYFNPKSIKDLCDYDVYPNGVGDHFEKRINFSIYKHPVKDIQFKYLLLGTNQKYYNTVEKIVPALSDTYGIITYNSSYVNKNLNNLYAPVQNLLGLFDTYIYTKQTFDPAPRLIQECKYYGKKIIYQRDLNIRDGGFVYYHREVKEPEIWT
jgi:hypothetical protein